MNTRKIFLMSIFTVSVGLLYSYGVAGNKVASKPPKDTTKATKSLQGCTFVVNTVGALGEALRKAQANNQDDVICIQAGIYRVDSTLIYETPNGDGGKKLTIKAVGGQVVLDGGNSVRIMSINTDSDDNGGDKGADVYIEWLTFKDGKVSGTGPSGAGGGLYISTREASVNFFNNTFINNNATLGGGIYIKSVFGSITFVNNTFDGNKASFTGGGIDILSGSGYITFNSNKFKDNISSEFGGGGIHLLSIDGNVTLNKNTFNNNSAKSGGGSAISSVYGTINLTSNIFENNSADTDGGGAVVVSSSGRIVLTNNTFSNNKAGHDGGGVYAELIEDGHVALTDNTFIYNQSKKRGGGADVISKSTGGVVLDRNVFISNSVAEHGGGAFIGSESGNILLTNNVFRNNIANAGGGGGVVVGSSAGITTFINNSLINNSGGKIGGGALIPLIQDSAVAYVYNNIFWQNTVKVGVFGNDLVIASDGNDNGKASIVHLFNNNFSGRANFTTGQSEDLFITLIQLGSYSQAGNIQKDPLFVNSSAGDFRLKAGSPCIDAGHNDPPGGLPKMDKDGRLRVIGKAVDIGAYEFPGR